MQGINPYSSLPRPIKRDTAEPLSHSFEIPTVAKSVFQPPNKVNPLLKFHDIIETNPSISTSYKELYQLIHSHEFNIPEQKYMYALLEKKFREIEFLDTPEAWIQRADLLDALDALVAKPSPTLSPLFSPIAVNTPPPSTENWKEETVPLVPYSKMKQTLEKIDLLGLQKLQTLVDVKEKLGDVTATEHTDTAKTVQYITRPQFFGAGLLHLFYRILTKTVGRIYTHPAFSQKALEHITHFSQKMGIQSVEVLSKKVSKPNGEKEREFYYRGPRFLFGQSIYHFKTVNDWFKRDLTPEARAEYLSNVHGKEEKLDSRYGKDETVSRIVISNSDCRVRTTQIAPGEFGKPQELTGKVLNASAEQQARQQKDDAAYYTRDYLFTTQNLLGRESDDPMQSRDLTAVEVEHLNANMDVIDQLEKKMNKAKPALAPVKMDKLKRTLLKQKKTQELIRQAQHELLGGFFRVFEEEGAVQVIQRLAPADIHNYVAPLDGTPLSHQKAAKVLKQRLVEKQEALKEKGAEDPQLASEIDFLENWIMVFFHQEQLLGRPSQATVDIYGTNASVSTPAIRNQSRILAQNDRKVMLFQHKDGSFSMHVFIGATGVNRVDVDPATSFKQQGSWTGDMQFGPDTYEAEGVWMAAGQKHTRDGVKKLRMGERTAGHPINGSTVISYYLPTDYALLPTIQEFTDAAAYGEGADRAKLEIQAKMGDSLLVKTEIALVDFLEENFPVLMHSQGLFTDLITAGEVLAEIPNLKLPQTAKAADRAALDFLQKLWSNDPDDSDNSLSLPELELKERIQETLERRLENL